jgi:hypothetical protein
MTLAPLRDALSILRVAFVRPDVLKHSEDIVVTLPKEAGQRFEQYLADNADPWIRSEPKWGMVIIDHYVTYRTISLDGVQVRWQPKMIATRDALVPMPMIEPTNVDAPRISLDPAPTPP